MIWDLFLYLEPSASLLSIQSSSSFSIVALIGFFISVCTALSAAFISLSFLETLYGIVLPKSYLCRNENGGGG